MLKQAINERPDWTLTAEKLGFKFHTMYGDKYWDESRFYQFSLEQVERDIEDATNELGQMCLQAVDHVVNHPELMQRFQIPSAFHQLVKDSWAKQEPSLYARMDLVYDGSGPAKLLENNADTPTSLYESAFWQWVWLEDQQKAGLLPAHADQFNAIQEQLIIRFHDIAKQHPYDVLHFSCCKGTEEDRGTVQYLEDCARAAGIECKFVYIEDIGEGSGGELTDLDDQVITWMFKLYPLEFMFREPYADLLLSCGTQMLEPYWKALLSNKAILPVLWDLFPNHPNLLESYFPDDPRAARLKDYVSKPIFAREGSNVSIYRDGQLWQKGDGPYGEEGMILQALAPLPRFGDSHTLIGSWLIDNRSCGMSIREDSGLVTRDMSRFVPHIIA